MIISALVSMLNAACVVYAMSTGNIGWLSFVNLFFAVTLAAYAGAGK